MVNLLHRQSSIVAEYLMLPTVKLCKPGTVNLPYFCGYCGLEPVSPDVSFPQHFIRLAMLLSSTVQRSSLHINPRESHTSWYLLMFFQTSKVKFSIKQCSLPGYSSPTNGRRYDLLHSEHDKSLTFQPRRKRSRTSAMSLNIQLRR